MKTIALANMLCAALTACGSQVSAIEVDPLLSSKDLSGEYASVEVAGNRQPNGEAMTFSPSPGGTIFEYPTTDTRTPMTPVDYTYHTPTAAYPVAHPFGWPLDYARRMEFLMNEFERAKDQLTVARRMDLTSCTTFFYQLLKLVEGLHDPAMEEHLIEKFEDAKFQRDKMLCDAMQAKAKWKPVCDMQRDRFRETKDRITKGELRLEDVEDYAARQIAEGAYEHQLREYADEKHFGPVVQDTNGGVPTGPPYLRREMHYLITCSRVKNRPYLTSELVIVKPGSPLLAPAN